MRRLARVLGWLLIAAGALVLTWVVVVWRWQDPFTAIYTHIEQSHLSHAYDRRVRSYHAPRLSGSVETLQRRVAEEARAYRASLHTGSPVGKLRIGRIGLDMVVVQGTDHATLEKGPGHYEGSGLPGEGHLVYVAGHRTTYLAPFAHINDIRVGDYITFSLPYATFTYRVQRHYIVPADAVQILRDQGREVLRLQACHPRFFATHRYIVDAALVSVALPNGPGFRPAATAAAS